jgi:hypothetical protein
MSRNRLLTSLWHRRCAWPMGGLIPHDGDGRPTAEDLNPMNRHAGLSFTGLYFHCSLTPKTVAYCSYKKEIKNHNGACY